MKKLILTIFVASCLSSSAYALPPQAPSLSVYESGNQIQLAWDAVDFADGYTLWYAGYPDFSNLATLGMGTRTSASAALPPGAAYWVAVRAYNQDGPGELSGVSHVVSRPASPVLSAPRLQLAIQGLSLTLSWEAVPGAAGYRILHSASSDFSSDTASVEVGGQTSVSVTLPNGFTRYIAVQAYNADGNSEISNIEHLLLDKRVVAFLPPASDSVGRMMRLGLNYGFQQFKQNWNGIGLEIVDRPEDPVLLKKLMFGESAEASGGASHRGYIDDPNVLAFVAPDTADTLVVSQDSHPDKPLVMVIDATNSALFQRDDMLVSAPSNSVQAHTMAWVLSYYAEQAQRVYRYAVVIENRPALFLDTFDLYQQLLSEAVSMENQSIAQGKSAGTMPAFAQMIGSLMFDGSAAYAQALAGALNMLKPDAVLYLGSAEDFSVLYANAPNQTWIVNNGNYDYELLKGGDVTILNIGSPGAPGEAPAYHAYNVAGLLGRLISLQAPDQLTRQTIRQAALGPDRGPPLIEGPPEGWFDLVRPGADGWEKTTPAP